MNEFKPSDYKILIVEDSSIQAEMLRRVLDGAGYQIYIAKDGAEGLALSKELRPDLILSDITMPVMDGFNMCHAIKTDKALEKNCVVMLTALTEVKDVIRALNAGADNYLTKPYNPESLLNLIKQSLVTQPYPEHEKKTYTVELPDASLHQVKASPIQTLNLLVSTYGNVVEQNLQLIKMQDQVVSLNASLAEKVKTKSDQLHVSELKIRQTLVDSIQAIASMVEMRDPYTAGHQRNVGESAVLIGERMGLSEEQIFGLHLASVVHDVGKINTPSEILNKPGKLSEIQYALVKEHVEAGYNTLKNIDFPWPIADIVYQHHERLDGSGYPRGLKGDEILLEARIIMVADVIDAMSTHRPYRPGLGIEKAKNELINNRGIHYDSLVVDTCLKLMDEGLIPVTSKGVKHAE
jgi:response regulator RpfG family c-di-GMP phosphodiesterase